MNLILKKILKFINDYKFTLLFLSFLLIITFNLAEQFSILNVLSAISFIFIFHLLSKYKLLYPIAIFIAIFIGFNAYFAFVLKEQMSYGVMASFMETYSDEALGMMSVIWWKVALTLGLLVAWIVFMMNELKKISFSRKISLAVVLIFWLIVAPTFITTNILDKHWLKRDFPTSPFYILFEVTGKDHPIIIRDIMVFGSYWGEKVKIKEYQEAKRTLPEGVTLKNEGDSILPKHIFVIIGESANRDYMSLYGYKEAKTTPFLDSIKSALPTKLNYYNGIAAAPITRFAVPMAVSFADPLNLDKQYTEKNIVEIANNAGYETIWLSSQPKVGVYETIIGNMASCATVSDFDYGWPVEDLDLVEKAKNNFKEGQKQLIILHLTGSHIPYGDKSDKIDKAIFPGKTNDILYWQSLHHTDRVLKGIYQLMDNTHNSAVMYYFSDHGEVIGQAHGFLTGGTAQFKTPIVAINRSKFPVDSVVNKYIDPKTSLLSTSNTVYIISEMLGYDIAPDVVKDAIEINKYVYHVDNKSYLYEDIMKKDK